MSSRYVLFTGTHDKDREEETFHKIYSPDNSESFNEDASSSMCEAMTEAEMGDSDIVICHMCNISTYIIICTYIVAYI